MPISANGIEQAIAGLNYRNISAVKCRLLNAIKQCYDGSESPETVRFIATDDLVRKVWGEALSPAEIQSKRKNLSSIKSTINADLDRAWREGRNPEGIMIAPDNTFSMSNEAKDQMLASFSGAVSSDGSFKMNDVNAALQLVSEFLSTRQGGEIAGELERLRAIVKKVADEIGYQDVSGFDMVKKGEGAQKADGESAAKGEAVDEAAFLQTGDGAADVSSGLSTAMDQVEGLGDAIAPKAGLVEASQTDAEESDVAISAGPVDDEVLETEEIEATPEDEVVEIPDEVAEIVDEAPLELDEDVELEEVDDEVLELSEELADTETLPDDTEIVETEEIETVPEDEMVEVPDEAAEIVEEAPLELDEDVELEEADDEVLELSEELADTETLSDDTEIVETEEIEVVPEDEVVEIPEDAAEIVEQAPPALDEDVEVIEDEVLELVEELEDAIPDAVASAEIPPADSESQGVSAPILPGQVAVPSVRESGDVGGKGHGSGAVARDGAGGSGLGLSADGGPGAASGMDAILDHAEDLVDTDEISDDVEIVEEAPLELDEDMEVVDEEEMLELSEELVDTETLFDDSEIVETEEIEEAPEDEVVEISDEDAEIVEEAPLELDEDVELIEDDVLDLLEDIEKSIATDGVGSSETPFAETPGSGEPVSAPSGDGAAPSGRKSGGVGGKGDGIGGTGAGGSEATNLSADGEAGAASGTDAVPDEFEVMPEDEDVEIIEDDAEIVEEVPLEVDEDLEIVDGEDVELFDESQIDEAMDAIFDDAVEPGDDTPIETDDLAEGLAPSDAIPNGDASLTNEISTREPKTETEDINNGVDEIVKQLLAQDPQNVVPKKPEAQTGDWLRNVGLPVEMLEEEGIDFENLENDLQNKKVLAARFDGFLGVMERYYNQLITIPGGDYIVGGKGDLEDELPFQKISLSEYYIGKFPITNATFEIFIDRTGYVTTAEKLGYGYVFYGRFQKIVDPKTGRSRSVWNPTFTQKKIQGASWFQPLGPGSSLHNKRNHPVVQVSIKDAMSFAAWTGRRLPTEREWEAAGRTKAGHGLPWGEEWRDNTCNVESTGISDTTPVNQYLDGDNPLGISDLLGNVMEWTKDKCEPKYEIKRKSVFYIAKGGGWIADNRLTLASRARIPADFSSNILGFRCAVD